MFLLDGVGLNGASMGEPERTGFGIFEDELF